MFQTTNIDHHHIPILLGLYMFIPYEPLWKYHRIPWFHKTQVPVPDFTTKKSPNVHRVSRLEVVAAVQASNSDAVVEGVGLRHHASKRTGGFFFRRSVRSELA